jgi:hypothetical protein
MILLHNPQLAVHVNEASLLPIVPILLLPFIIIFFVLVVPIWFVALGVIGLVLLIMRGLERLAHLAGSAALDAPAAGVYRAWRWVLTFGGFTERGKSAPQQPHPGD